MTSSTDARRPIRVAFLNGSLEIGGSERQMVELATRLPRDRFAPEFVLLTRRGPLADVAEGAGIPVHVLNWARLGDRWRRTRRLGDIVRTAALIRRGRYDIVDAWLFHAYAIAAAIRPVIGVDAIISGRRNLGDARSNHPINRALDAIARRRIDAIVANSDGVRRAIAARERISASRIQVIHNGVELPEPLEPEIRDRIRHRLGATPDSLLIGCVANYKNRKGLDTVIEVASVVTSSVAGSMFVLVGEGPLRPDLEQAIAAAGLRDRVLLHGQEPDARDIVGGFDIALQASTSEGLPNALLESAAAGVPIVATDVGGTPEIVVEGVTGRLVAPGEVSQFVGAIRWLAEDTARRRSMGSAGRSHIRDCFGMDRFVAETAALYEAVLARRAGR